MIGMARASRFAALVALAAVLASAPAHGADSAAEKEARRSFAKAENHFRAGLFAEALAEYQAGYDAAPLPGFLINIAQCYRRLGDLTRAQATYRKFVLVAPDSPLVPQVNTLIAELEKLQADLVDTKAPAPEPADTTPPPPAAAAALAPAPPPAVVEPGQAVTAPGADLRADTGPRPNEPARATRWWLWCAIGAVAIGGAATTFMLLRSPGTTTVHDGSLGALRR